MYLKSHKEIYNQTNFYGVNYMLYNQKSINKWLKNNNINLKPYFTETLRSYAIPYGKNII